MRYTEKTIKALWGRAANLCAFCRKPLILDGTETDDESVVGDMAHIVARNEDGNSAPRAVAHLSQADKQEFARLIENRNKYSNLILLCKVHHKMVDDQEHTFPIARLLSLKKDHEDWVSKSLVTFDAQKQADDEVYAAYVDHWADKLSLNEWGWTSGIFCFGQPSLPKVSIEDLIGLQKWLLTRIWPGRYLNLEQSFKEFRWVANDFVNVFQKHSELKGDMFWTENFYRRAYDGSGELGLAKKLEQEFDYHVDLVKDLGAELIRSANRICDQVRSSLDRTFLLEQGRLIIQEGPDDELRWHEFVTQYRTEENYRGLSPFLTDRSSRDVHYGSGPPPRNESV